MGVGPHKSSTMPKRARTEPQVARDAESNGSAVERDVVDDSDGVDGSDDSGDDLDHDDNASTSSGLQHPTRSCSRLFRSSHS